MMQTMLRSQALRHLIVIGSAFIMIYPLLWMLSSSFKAGNDLLTDLSLWPSNFTLDHYREGWKGVSRVSFERFYLNTFVLVLTVIAGNLISCSLAAFAFARLQFRFKKLMFAIMLVTMMLPFHVIIIPQYIMFNQLDWIDTYFPLFVPKFFAVEGFFIFLMVQFMRGLPVELDQAATVDGCGSFQIFWRLVLPLSLPALVTTAIFTFLWTWNDFFSQLLYISSIQKYTISLGLRMYMASDGEAVWGRMFAMSVLSLIPVFALFVYFQKYLIEGITSGGVKG
jgi:multiple sugar transport system permease protein